MALSFSTCLYQSKLPDVLLAGAYEEHYFVGEPSKEDTDFRVNSSSIKRLRSQEVSFKDKKSKTTSSLSSSLKASEKRSFLEGLNPKLIKGSILGKMLEDEPDDCEVFKSICGRVYFVACQQLVSAMKADAEEKLKPELTEKLRSIAQKVTELDFEGVSKLTREGIAEIEAKKELAFQEINACVSSISSGQLQTVIQILDRLIEALKDESKVSQLIDFCLNEYDVFFSDSRVSDQIGLLRFQILFEMFDCLKLDEFQREFFEPFNEKFPSYPPSKTPKNIKQIKFADVNLRECDAVKFSCLEEIDLCGCTCSLEEDIFLSEEKKTLQKFFEAISNKEKIRVIKLRNIDINDLDLSKFINLNKLDLDYLQGDMSLLFDTLDGRNLEVIESKFNRFRNIKFLELTSVKKLTLIGVYKRSSFLEVNQFNEGINASIIEKLYLKNINVMDFDFSRYTALKELKLDDVYRLNSFMFNSIPNKGAIENLELKDNDVEGFDFSGFSGLNYLDLSSVSFLTGIQLNSISNKGSIEYLNLSSVDVEGFGFSGFIGLKELILDAVRFLTATQFNAIPNKGAIEHLNLNGVDVTGFDFSGFIGLKSLDLKDVEGLTRDQFNSIPNKNFTKKQISWGV
jgi:hypothetical protein